MVFKDVLDLLEDFVCPLVLDNPGEGEHIRAVNLFFLEDFGVRGI